MDVLERDVFTDPEIPPGDPLIALDPPRYTRSGLPAPNSSSILFAAGQETTARLLGAGMRILAEQPALAEELRRDPEAIPGFVVECLRLCLRLEGLPLRFRRRAEAARG